MGPRPPIPVNCTGKWAPVLVHPERGHADPITRADILNACTCGPRCCLQPLSCLAGPQKPSGTFFLFSFLFPSPSPHLLHHYRPHAFPETSWVKQLDVLDGYHMFLLWREAAPLEDMLRRIRQAVLASVFLCAFFIKYVAKLFRSFKVIGKNLWLWHFFESSGSPREITLSLFMKSDL